MKRLAVVLLVVFVLLPGIGLPSLAWAGGWHGGCCRGGWWGPGLFVGGLALGAAVTAPYRYPYYYAPPAYGYYAPPAVVYEQAPAYQQAPAYTAPPAPAVQREVVFPNGKYVLHGDGVTQAWQWVWIQAVPPAPPPPR